MNLGMESSNGRKTAKAKDPLEGVTLEKLLAILVDHYGWDGLAERIRVNCFHFEPSLKSSLHFLRRTPWARTQVENLYLEYLERIGSRDL